MLCKPYGKTGKMISVISSGGMRFLNPQDIDGSAATVLRAYKSGVNYFDTAPGYCADKSEDITGAAVRQKVAEALRRGLLVSDFSLRAEQEAVLAMMDKYADVPMSLADACLVRMTEVRPDPLLFTTDGDFRIYRRHSRQVVPCRMP